MICGEYKNPYRHPGKSEQMYFIIISKPEHMLRVIKRTISFNRFMFI